MHDSQTPIADFLTAAAAKRPTPGGGAVAALVGALAAAMGEMVLNYSVAKKDLAPHAEHNIGALWAFTDVRQRLLKLMADDQAAFAALTDAKKAGLDPLPLVRLCIDVPRNVVGSGLQVLRIANDVAATSNAFLISDLAVCGECAMAAVRAGVHNVAANWDYLPEDERVALQTDMRQATEEAVRLIQRLSAAITARQAAS